MVLKKSRTSKNTGNTTRSAFSSRQLRKFVPHHSHLLKLVRRLPVRQVIDDGDDSDSDDEYACLEIVPSHATFKELARSTGIRRWLSWLFHPDLRYAPQQKQRWHLLDCMKRAIETIRTQKFTDWLRILKVMVSYGAWDQRHVLYFYFTDRESVIESFKVFGTTGTASDAYRLYSLWCEMWKEAKEEKLRKEQSQKTKTVRIRGQPCAGVQRWLPKSDNKVRQKKNRDSKKTTTDNEMPIPGEPQPAALNRQPQRDPSKQLVVHAESMDHRRFWESKVNHSQQYVQGYWSLRHFQRCFKFERVRKKQNERDLAEQLANTYYTEHGNIRFFSDQEGYASGSFLEGEDGESGTPRSSTDLMGSATASRRKLRGFRDKCVGTPDEELRRLGVQREQSAVSRQVSFFLTEVTDFDAAFSDLDDALSTCTLPARELRMQSVRTKFLSAVDFGKCAPFTAVFNLRGALKTAEKDGADDSDAGSVDGWLLVCQAAHDGLLKQPGDSRVKISLKLHGEADETTSEAANTRLKQTLRDLKRDTGGDDVFPSLDVLLRHVCHSIRQTPNDTAMNISQGHTDSSSSGEEMISASGLTDMRCSNCFTLYDGREVCGADVALFVTMATCGHSFCRRCWQRHLVCGILSGKRTLLCMGYKCGTNVDASTVLSLVPNWAFMRWQQQLKLDMKAETTGLRAITDQRSQTLRSVATETDSERRSTTQMHPTAVNTPADLAEEHMVARDMKQKEEIKEKKTLQKPKDHESPRDAAKGKNQPRDAAKGTAGIQLAVTGEQMTRQKRTVKATVPVARPTPRPTLREAEVLSKTSLLRLARGLGKDSSGLTLPMLLNMPTTTIINAIYNDDDDTTTTNKIPTLASVKTSKTLHCTHAVPCSSRMVDGTACLQCSSTKNDKPETSDRLPDKDRGVWMLERCLLAWHHQTSGLQDDIRMRSLERALVEMGKAELAAGVMQCYRDKKKISSSLFKTSGTLDKKM